MKSLLTITDLGREGIEEVLDRAQSYIGLDGRAIYNGELRNRTIATLFFENSTRTRLSFHSAAQHLDAKVLDFSTEASSLNKGESFEDTVRAIDAMHPDVIVVRHRQEGTPDRIDSWVEAAVVNAGDGTKAHPTQALLDCLTIRQLRPGGFEGLRIAMVGDIDHSRCARSCTEAFTAMGAEVTLVGPPQLTTKKIDWTFATQVEVSHELDDAIPKADIVYTIRVQKERLGDDIDLSMDDYVARYCLTQERVARLAPAGLVMDAGPVIRGVQMDVSVLDAPNCTVLRQVANGVPVRMAVLALLARSDG